ncbi:MAG TPA: CHAT domain-containing tetratricopeptide repeat protein [Chloroflexota bacterium]|nr:CHAT domain-containing tetratricopeptide repeat protein [Chloroflexota bacterium]
MSDPDLELLIGRLAAAESDEERQAVLRDLVEVGPVEATAERLKAEADRLRYQDLTASLRWSDHILALGQLAQSPTITALGMMVEALIRQLQGDPPRALALFDQASTLFLTHGHRIGWARTQIGRTGALMATGKVDEALERAEQARVILQDVGDFERVAALDNNLALLMERLNRPADALRYCDQALAAYRAAGSAFHVVSALGNRALVLSRLGRGRDALAGHREARQGFVDLCATHEVVQEDLNIGLTHLALGNFAEAASYLSAARYDLRAAGRPQLAATAGLHLAECLTRLGRTRQAIALCREVHGEFEGIDALGACVQALLWQAQGQLALRDHDAALQTLDSATAIPVAFLQAPAYRVSLDVLRARLLLDTGRIGEAVALLAPALAPLDQAGLALDAATARALLAEARLAQGETEEADSLATHAYRMAASEDVAWLEARALHLRGSVARTLGDVDAAWEYVATAARRAGQAHRRVAWDDRAAFAGATAPIFADAVELALERRQPALALLYVERAKSAALAEHLRGGIDVRPRPRDERSRRLIEELIELKERGALLHATRRGTGEKPVETLPWAAIRFGHHDDRTEAARIEERIVEVWRDLQANNPAYSGDAAALDLTANLISDEGPEEEGAERWLAGVQTALGSGDDGALLEYSALGNDLVLFVVRGGTVHDIRLPSAMPEVQRLVALWRLNVESAAAAVGRGSSIRALDANARALLRRLYTVLLAPASGLLDGATRLTVVPYGPTHHVPFHALHDGLGFLLERDEVRYTPCAGLLEHFAARRRGATGAGALAFAFSPDGALPHTGQEGESVVAVLGGTLLQGAEATRGNLRQLAGQFAVLHLAAHGAFHPDEPLLSSLDLSDGRITTLEVFELDLHCSLVTLSACETALGAKGAGDELMGLSRAFLYAGAPALVLSLWKVEDRSTSVLMERFYRGLAAGLGIGSALRQAQLALLRHETVLGDHAAAPYFWAPFQLIGDPAPIA